MVLALNSVCMKSTYNQRRLGGMRIAKGSGGGCVICPKEATFKVAKKKKKLPAKRKLEDE